VLGQEAVPDKANELTAIPVLLTRLGEQNGLRGALVSIDAIATNATIATAITTVGADYLLAVKANQPTLRAEIEACFKDAPPQTIASHVEHDKGHGRIETRVFTASKVVDWIESDKSYPGQPRFKDIRTILHVLNRTEYADRCTFDTRIYISSAPLDIERLAAGSRSHWGVESMHWVLDVEFKDDLSRYRAGHGAKNMAVVRRFALGLLRANKSNLAHFEQQRTESQRAEHGQADEIKYYPKQGIVRLCGHAQMSDGQSTQITAPTFVYHVRDHTLQAISENGTRAVHITTQPTAPLVPE